jgi:hypothetical protein
MMTPLDAVPARASRDASNIAGRYLGDAMDEMALPETAAAYHGANDAYEKAAGIANMARAKQRELDSQGTFSLPNIGRTLGGVAGGATLGGQVAGIPGAIVGGVAGFAGNKAMQNYGPDMMADFLRSGPGMRDAAVGGTIGGMVAGPAGAIGGAALGGMGRPGVQAATGAGQAITGARDRGEDPGAAAQRELEQGRGYMLTDAALDALRNEPQALGTYARQFADAMQSNDPDAVGVLIQRLSRTDPNFRTQVLPALRARTGGM